MARIMAFGVSLAALATLSACGDRERAAAAPEATEAAEIQIAEAAPQPQPAPAADLALTQDFSSETANITLTVPMEAAQDRALYDLLQSDAQPQIEEAHLIADEDKAARVADDFPFNKHELQIAWAAPFANDRVVSLMNTTYLFQGGAHPNAYFATKLWNRQAQAEIAVTDLFTDAAWAALSPLAEQALLAEKRARLGDGLSDEEYWTSDVILATAPAAENFSVFTLVPSAQPGRAGGIALHYSPYEVGPYVEGDYHIVIPQAAFADYVAADYADLFGGEPAAAAD